MGKITELEAKRLSTVVTEVIEANTKFIIATISGNNKEEQEKFKLEMLRFNAELKRLVEG